MNWEQLLSVINKDNFHPAFSEVLMMLRAIDLLDNMSLIFRYCREEI